MRHLLTSIAFCCATLLAAQVPQAFDLQAVARDASGNVLGSQAVGLRLTVHSGTLAGPAVYQEAHSTTTSTFGIFNVAVGEGTPLQGAFATIEWGAAAHFLQVELDATGGSSYTDMGTTQLLSVPYALRAGSVDCFSVSLLGDTLRQGSGCHVIIPGLSLANGGCGDLDGDGFYGHAGCPPLDCDDADATSFPGATEICGDGRDNDCDGIVDNNADTNAHITWYLDADGDSYGDPASSTVACAQPAGYVDNGDDCNDSDAAIFPGQGCSLVCTTAERDWIDQNMSSYLDQIFLIWANCFGSDPSCVEQQLVDLELSGTVPLSLICHSCAFTYVECIQSNCALACLAGPFGTECTECIATNCRQEFIACAGLIDADGDGWSAGSDCNDSDAAIYPGATEACDGVDNDCDGNIDDADTQVAGNFFFFRDADGDGFGDENVTIVRCTNVVPMGYVLPAFPSDCNDQEPTVYPGAPEICDSEDNDCDGLIDEDESTWFIDVDGDGFGSNAFSGVSCVQPFGYVDNDQDCDDSRDDIFPGALENCTDGVDNDCDGIVDEQDLGVWYEDLDGDGFGNDGVLEVTCDPSAGYAMVGGDCDDGNPDIRPNATEICGNGADDDCDGLVDETCVPEICDGLDNDGDGLIDEDFVQEPCGCGGFTVCINGQVICIGSAEEVCDGIDNDCDGLVDEAGVCGTDCGFFNGTQQGTCGFGDQCVNGFCVPCADNDADGFTDCDGDCDDSNSAIGPGAAELCDGIDNNCDGLIDEGGVCQ